MQHTVEATSPTLSSSGGSPLRDVQVDASTMRTQGNSMMRLNLILVGLGRWLIVANDDHDWGCFIVDVADPVKGASN
jgi:hypothetical protein